RRAHNRKRMPRHGEDEKEQYSAHGAHLGYAAQSVGEEKKQKKNSRGKDYADKPFGKHRSGHPRIEDVIPLRAEFFVICLQEKIERDGDEESQYRFREHNARKEIESETDRSRKPRIEPGSFSSHPLTEEIDHKNEQYYCRNYGQPRRKFGKAENLV